MTAQLQRIHPRFGRRVSILPQTGILQYRSIRLLLVLIVFAAVVLLLPIWLPPPNLTSGTNALLPPSPQHWFGTDQLGRDVFSRVVNGARISWSIGMVTAIVSLCLGGTYGAVAAFARGRVDNALMRILEVNLAFPGMLLAIVLATTIGPGFGTVIVVLGFVYAGPVARFVHGLIGGQLRLEYVESAVAIGTGQIRILLRHMLPNIALPLMVFMTTVVAEVILIEAGLSFIGAGVVPPDPSWGSIVNGGQALMLAGAWWVALFAGAAIALTVIALNSLADTIVDEFRIGGHLG